MENGELQGCRTPSFDEVKYAVSNRRPIRAQHSPRNGHLICIAPRKNMTVQASLGLGHHPRLRVEALERRPGQGQPVGVHAHRCLIGAVNGSSTKVGDSERSEWLPTSHSRQSANFHLEKFLEKLCICSDRLPTVDSRNTFGHGTSSSNFKVALA